LESFIIINHISFFFLIHAIDYLYFIILGPYKEMNPFETRVWRIWFCYKLTKKQPRRTCVDNESHINTGLFWYSK